MSLTWVTLIQKQSVLFNLMHHTHVRAISGSAEACLHTAQTIMLMCQYTVWIQLIMPQFIRLLLYKRHFYTKTPERLICWLSGAALCMPLHNHFFSSFQCLGLCPHVSLKHESYYVCDSLHISDICGWYWGWGPSWREVHKNLSTTETETFCDESADNVSLFIYSRALEAGALCPAWFFSYSPGGLWGEG